MRFFLSIMFPLFFVAMCFSCFNASAARDWSDASLTNLSPQYFYFGHEQAKPRWEMTSIFLVTSLGPCAAQSSDSDGISSQWPVWVDERDNILKNSQDILRHCWFGACEWMNRGGIVYAQPVHHSKGTLLMPWNWFAHCHNTITYITLHTIYRK